jgi:PAS domain S-box-containing protein
VAELPDRLASRDALLTALINSASDTLIFSLDRHGCYTAFNHQHREEMRRVWDVDICVGMCLLDVMRVPELRDLARQSIERALKGEAFAEIQHQPDSSVYYELHWAPIHLDHEIVGVTAFIQDITERRQAEAALRAEIAERKRAVQILAIQARVAAVFTTLPDDEMYNEVLKVILDVMRSPFGVFGYLDETGGLVVPTMTRQVWDQCQTPGKAVHFPRDTWGDSSWPRAIREKSANYSNVSSSNIPMGHVGIHRHISLPILFHGDVVGLFQVANSETDYSEADLQTLGAISEQIAPLLSARLERERAQDALKTLNVELEQRVTDRTERLAAANKELEAFSYSVSHDLRAPLRAIDGFGHILTDDHAHHLCEEGRRVLGVICSEAARMGRLIDDLLAFSKMSRQPMLLTDVDVEAMARDVFDACAAQTGGRTVRLHLQALPTAHADSAMIRQVLVNLISNAIKFTGTRDAARIDIEGRIHGNETIYSVRDNGVGFDMRYAGKLFGVFQRLHSDAEFEGTGVGLALVQRIIQRHGGRVWAEGQVDGGAAFYFALPGYESDHGHSE